MEGSTGNVDQLAGGEAVGIALTRFGNHSRCQLPGPSLLQAESRTLRRFTAMVSRYR
jgi:hypothetical protein